MKNRKTRKFLSFMLTLAMCAAMLMPVTAAAASPAPTCAKSQVVYFEKTEAGFTTFRAYRSFIYIKNLSSKAVISGLKSSNKEVKAVKLSKNLKMNAICLESNVGEYVSGAVKNNDRTKITFNVKQNGKTYKLSCDVLFKTAPSPVKSFKVGGKEYAGYFKGYGMHDAKKPSGSKTKISIVPESGYKIDNIYVFYKNGSKKIKSGDSVSLKNATGICVEYYTTKKPANYQKPGNWTGRIPSPLHDVINLMF